MWCLWAGLGGKVVERGGVDSWEGLEGVVGRIMVEVVVGGGGVDGSRWRRMGVSICVGGISQNAMDWIDRFL